MAPSIYASEAIRPPSIYALPARTSPFLAPNERSPKDLKPLIDHIKIDGTYVSVGTERGFIASSFSKKIKNLLLIDRDLSVTVFNKINVALLRAAFDRSNYLHLRLMASAEDWKNVGVTVSPYETGELWQWWNRNVRQRRSFQIFHREAFNSSEPFAHANYLYSDRLFERLKQLADKNKIRILQADLGAPGLKTKINQSLPAGSQIAVFDVSNSTQEVFLGHAGTVQLLEEISPIVDDETVFLSTAQSTNSNWVYIGFRFKEIRKQPFYDFYDQYFFETKKYIRNFGDTRALLDGLNVEIFTPKNRFLECMDLLRRTFSFKREPNAR